jgi:hypothetical protein
MADSSGEQKCGNFKSKSEGETQKGSPAASLLDLRAVLEKG